MKRAVIVLALAAVAAVGVDVLGDFTQDRPDVSLPGSRSEIVLKVTNRDAGGSKREAAEGLWAVCQATVRNRLQPPGVVDVGAGRFRLVTQPSVGEHAWRRLKGCFEDLGVDRALARVVSKRDLPPSSRG